jgi:hypothetical protein
MPPRSRRKSEDDSLFKSLCKLICDNQIGRHPLPPGAMPLRPETDIILA